MGWCFFSHLVLRCTNRHQNKPISICLCSWDGAFTRILYFGAQTGTKTSLYLVVYNYGVVLLLVSCTSMYKQAPNQNFFQLFMFMRWCFFSHLVLWCANMHQNKPILVVYVHGMVLLVASCTSVYKQAPKQTFF